MPAERGGVLGQALAVAFRARIARFDDASEREEERLRGFEIVGEALEPHQRSDARLQLLGVHRLVQEVVGAGVEAGEARLALLLAADQHDRREARVGVAFELGAHVEAGDARHEHVEQHEVRTLALDDLERVAAVGRGQHGVVGVLEQQAQPAQVGLVVVDDQHLPRFGHRGKGRGARRGPGPSGRKPAQKRSAPPRPITNAALDRQSCNQRETPGAGRCAGGMPSASAMSRSFALITRTLRGPMRSSCFCAGVSDSSRWSA